LEKSSKTTKRRSIPTLGPYKGTVWWSWTNPNFGTSGMGSDSGEFSLASLQGSQTTDSENHPDFRRILGRMPFSSDIGGDFQSIKMWCPNKKLSNIYVFEGLLISQDGTRSTAKYRGPVYVREPSLITYPSSAQSSNAALSAWGATAIARCKPTNSVADASVFLTELLREGIPSIGKSALERWRSVTGQARKAPGSAYLDYQFGWKPIVSDVQKLAFAVTHADAVMKQFERDSGRLVRRRFEFPLEQSTVSEVAMDHAIPALPAAHTALFVTGTPTGQCIRTTTVVRRRWFSGAFTYYLAPDYSSRDQIARAVQESKKLLGLSLTPEVVWNLAPWSWAVDWFSNVGDVLSNISDYAVDSLMLQYGYIMEHTTSTVTYSWSGDNYLANPAIKPLPISLVTETKCRRRANPFGFGLTWGGLSPRQLAIAAALGINKS